MKIFIIAGKAGSGKGEVAKLINEFYIYKLQNNVITEYSKYIKEYAKELTEWDGISKNKPRDFLQSFGSKIRSYDKYFFTKRMIEDIKVYSFANIDNVIIADTRLPEEIEKIKENYDNVYTICVENQFAPSTLTIEQQAHITEIALDNYDDFDYIVANDSLDKLKPKIFAFLEGIENNEK